MRYFRINSVIGDNEVKKYVYDIKGHIGKIKGHIGKIKVIYHNRLSQNPSATHRQ